MLETRSLEDRLHELESTLARLSQRVATLEGDAAAPAPRTSTAVSHEPRTYSLAAASALSLVGRTSIVLGGAFLLRALTESGRLPRTTGTALGLTYAVVWLVAADRAAAARARPSAIFHGVVSMFIALPLVFEGATRFSVFSPLAGAGVLAGFAALALAIAARQHLQSLGALAALGAILAAFAVALATDAPLPPAVLLVALAAVTLWIAYARAWAWLRWPASLAADLMLLYLTIREAGPQPIGAPGATIALNVALSVICLGAIARRTLFGKESVLVFDVVQSLGVLGLVILSAFTLAHGSLTTALGSGLLAAGVGTYVAVLRSPERRDAVSVGFYFHTALALVLVVVASALMLPAPALAIGASAGALVMTWLGARWGRPALSLHGLIWLIVAALSSGWFTVMLTLWVGAVVTWPAMPPLVWTTCLATWLCVAVPRIDRAGADRLILLAPRVAALLFAAASAATLVLRLAGPWMSGTPADAARLAMARTVILAGGTLTAAAVSRIKWIEHVGLLVYPLLAIGAVQLLSDDLRAFRAAPLFVALAAYGLALVIAPRVAKFGAP